MIWINLIISVVIIIWQYRALDILNHIVSYFNMKPRRGALTLILTGWLESLPMMQSGATWTSHGAPMDFAGHLQTPFFLMGGWAGIKKKFDTQHLNLNTNMAMLGDRKHGRNTSRLSFLFQHETAARSTYPYFNRMIGKPPNDAVRCYLNLPWGSHGFCRAPADPYTSHHWDIQSSPRSHHSTALFFRYHFGKIFIAFLPLEVASSFLFLSAAADFSSFNLS